MKTNRDLPSCRMKRNRYLSLSGPSSVPGNKGPSLLPTTWGAASHGVAVMPRHQPLAGEEASHYLLPNGADFRPFASTQRSLKSHHFRGLLT